MTEGDRNQQQTAQLDLRQWGPGSGIHCVIKSKLGLSGPKIVRKHCAREAQKWQIRQLTVTQDTEQLGRLGNCRGSAGFNISTEMHLQPGSVHSHREPHPGPEGPSPFIPLGLEELLRRSWELCSLLRKYRDLNALGAERILLSHQHTDGI